MEVIIRVKLGRSIRFVCNVNVVNESFVWCRCHSGFGTPADLDPPGPYLLADLDPGGPNPLADMDPPSQIWTSLPNFPFKHSLYHI